MTKEEGGAANRVLHTPSHSEPYLTAEVLYISLCIQLTHFSETKGIPRGPYLKLNQFMPVAPKTV